MGVSVYQGSYHRLPCFFRTPLIAAREEIFEAQISLRGPAIEGTRLQLLGLWVFQGNSKSPSL